MADISESTKALITKAVESRQKALDSKTNVAMKKNATMAAKTEEEAATAQYSSDLEVAATDAAAAVDALTNELKFPVEKLLGLRGRTGGYRP